MKVYGIVKENYKWANIEKGDLIEIDLRVNVDDILSCMPYVNLEIPDSCVKIVNKGGLKNGQIN